MQTHIPFKEDSCEARKAAFDRQRLQLCSLPYDFKKPRKPKKEKKKKRPEDLKRVRHIKE